MVQQGSAEVRSDMTLRKSFLTPVLLVFMTVATVIFGGEPGMRRFGKDVAFSADDLPDSELRRKLRVLPAAKHARAMERLKSVSFSVEDVKNLRADDAGEIFYVCEISAEAKAFMRALAPTAEAAAESEPPVAAAPIPIANPPVYHSRPGSSRVVILDFNGHYVTGTAWNGSSGDFDAIPFDTDGDITTFNDSEQTAIKRVWQRVAEDFAPFDVDVTTQEPATITNSTGRLLITRNTDRNGKANPSTGAGGVAYLSVFGSGSYGFYSPAWVYSNNLANREDYIAEAASHEMGHNLGLSHDGTSTGASYYSGHGGGETSWSTLMGTGYNQNVSQWSKGEYTNANNTQDDLQIISGRLTYRADDHGNSNGAATELTRSGTSISSTTPETDVNNNSPQNKGVIETTADIDVFRFSTGAGAITLNVNPWITPSNTRGGNLDIRADLYDAVGNLLRTENPDSTTGVTINYTASEGTYFLHVQGVGVGAPLGSPANGYTEYGSIGQYFISGTVQLPAGDQTPPTASLNASSVTTGGGTTHTFTVTYNDDIAVNVSSLDSNDLRVTGPSGFNTLASYISVNPTGNGSPRTATYRINAPGGTWDLNDNGAYTVALQGSQVSDTFGRFAAAATLGTISVNVPLPPGPGTGIRRELFTNIAGVNVSDLTSSAAYQNNAATSASLLNSLFETPSNFADNYGQRVHGYFIAPVTGTYFFTIASDDSSQLWLSTNDNSATAAQIAFVDGFTGEREWGKYASQRSSGISLTSGSRYYIRALQKEGAGGDNLAVGVEYPNGSMDRPIPAHRLDPFVPASYTATVSATDATASETQGNSGAFAVSIAPPSLSAITVNVKFDGSATYGTDYNSIATTVTIPAGQSSAMITVVPVNDTKFEGNETVVVTLLTGSGYALGSPVSATVTIQDNDTNSAPVATNASFDVVRNIPLSKTLNATDVDAQPLTYSIVAIPMKGSVTIVNPASGAIIYTPNPGAMGPDSFTFRANDGFVNSNTATVTLNIQNGVPTAISEQFTISAMLPSINTLNAGDADGDALTVELLTLPSQGAVSIDPATLQFTFTPASGAVGTDSFSYRLSDGVAQSPAATVSLVFLPRIELSSSASATPNPALENVPVLFSVAGSGAGSVVWVWNFGDGSGMQGSQAAHSFSVAGSYNVIVTGTDAAGQTVSATIAMVISDETEGGGGGASPPLPDSDGDGVADVFEVLDGTNPNDATSATKIPFTISKAAGIFNFKKAVSDGVALSGIIPELSRGFTPASAPITFIINGSTVALTLDAKGKGRAKTATASLGLKLKYGKKSKTSKTAAFMGGNTPFKFKLAKSDLTAAWNIDPALTTAGQQLRVTVDAIVGGRIYTATVDTTYKAKAGSKGVFKKNLR